MKRNNNKKRKEKNKGEGSKNIKEGGGNEEKNNEEKNNEEEYNKIATKILFEHGEKAFIEHIFKHPETKKELTYAEMRCLYG